jgi:glycosyltransferase involved in cell wall biosynthesis
MQSGGANEAAGIEETIDVSIVMPCLNEARSLRACIANARSALAELRARLNLVGEIILADNGSSDGSQAMALDHGARVVAVAARGYGAALMGGASAARGRYLVMGDADGSYDFHDAVAMIAELTRGADLCMGSRFRGKILPGAMPWKNRYIGNPILTGILNLLFKAGISDAHCGLRALTRGCFERLGLKGTGMEFASEMVIKAALKGERIVEVPATLAPDTRDRPPHLRPWRDGWRHLRYLLMLSPTWVFALPAMILAVGSLLVLVTSGVMQLMDATGGTPFGNYWIILAGAMLGVAHTSGLLAAATHLYGIREGYRRPGPRTSKFSRWISLETMLMSGLAAAIGGLIVLFMVVGYWSAHGFTAIGSVLPAVLGTMLIVVGAQNALGGFLLAIVGGNEASFLRQPARQPMAMRRAPEVPAASQADDHSPTPRRKTAA